MRQDEAGLKGLAYPGMRDLVGVAPSSGGNSHSPVYTIYNPPKTESAQSVLPVMGCYVI